MDVETTATGDATATATETPSPAAANNQPPAVPATDSGQEVRKTPFQIIRDWPLSRKIATGAVLVISILLFAILIIQARTANQQLLYANLSLADASAVTTWLKGQNIEYTIKNGGKDIWIPADQIYQARLDLASNGLPSGGGVGFEVFDKQSFALTDYVQKVNYTRALQGELARTISSLAPVESTRVHLALPEKRLFKNQQKSGTASVIVSLVPGKHLNPKQVKGIIHLVAASVTNLEPENVKVIDSNGVELESEKQQEEDELLSTNMLAFQQQVENTLEMRVQDLLDKTMGRDNAMVRISASLDFTKVEQTEEKFDGDDPVVRSEQVNQETSGSQTAGGIPGVQSNLQGLGPSGSQNSGTSKNSRITNYEISKTVSRIVNPVGTVKNLSVSVLVADRREPGEKEGETRTVPRSAAELKSIEDMVATAIGLIPDRGDQISVISMPFADTDSKILAQEGIAGNPLYEYLPLVKYGLICLGMILLYFLLVRPVIKTMKGDVQQYYKTVQELEQEEARPALPPEPEEEEMEEPPVDDAIVALRKEIKQNHIPTAFIIKNWIQEG